jgi:chromosomal replication initiator protein
MNTKELWENTLKQIEKTISKPNFQTWFKDSHIAKFDQGTIYLSVSNAFIKNWLQSKFHNEILKVLRALSPSIRSLEYVITKENQRRRVMEIDQGTSFNSELPLDQYYIDRADNLNPKYSFENLIVGPFNELAHAAAQAIVKKPGITYNPLFVYGSTGHGKTHLIQAVGNQIKKSFPGKRLHYITSEKFAQNYVNAVQNNKMAAFKEKYRKYDVLIMDDIQFFAKKASTQEELFHLFNTLYENNKQIIFSSDQHPNFIPGLEDRLKSRFAAGMIVDIPQPELESRLEILKKKFLSQNLAMDIEIIDYLATNVAGNIRDLEGIVNSIICQMDLRGRELSLGEVKNIIKNTAKPKKQISSQEVIKTIADFYNVNVEDILEKTRRKEIVRPRQIIMYILREEFDISYPSIGNQVGGRDHTTVIHSCEKMKDELKRDSNLAQEISQIKSILL